ncbi:MAG: hypothetical protein GXO29_04105 [Thermotogae bacterium]|nr:hypothetical protein [Thermotogota bacterium]
MGKDKLSASVEEVLRVFEPLVEGWDEDTTDGHYYRRGDEWLHVRASNTEPVVRVIWEGSPKFYDEVARRLEDLKRARRDSNPQPPGP